MMQTGTQQQLPPLTEKDLAFLKDYLSWELVAAKKAFQYSHQTMETECQQLMIQIAQQHQQNVERLEQHLNEHANQVLQASIAGTQATVAPIHA